ncbi:acyl carrier protein [Ramlibacter sp.]|uniref:acyl carrier protein n=1 Tax=Ramlibacter sp. TaxID=1917967 RepID=UPI0035AF8FA7
MQDVAQLIASVLQVDPARLSDEDGVETLEQWDSLRIVLLASMIEVSYGLTLQSEEIDSLTSVRAVRAVLARHGVA